jgi:cytochrome bd-type quinol oxidase subunit 1
VQVLLVTVLVFVFFVVFGVITLTRGVMYTWVGRRLEVIHEWKVSGDTFVLTEELLKVAIFLAAFSGLYFTVVLLTDATYREEFLERVVSDVRDAFAARAAYLAYLQQGR